MPRAPEGVNLGPVNVAEVVAEVVSIMQPLAERKGLGLRTRLAEVPRVFESDVGRLRRILLNLVGNAVKFAQDDEVTIVVHPASSAACSPAPWRATWS